MDNVTAVNVTRQTALQAELDVLATNLANMSTNGYRREGLVFSEYVKAVEGGDLGSLSMADARARYVDLSQGQLTRTGGRFDLAIEGEGFFQIETPDGPRLTRSGSFSPSPEGELVDVEGRRLLDAGGGAIFIPTEVKAITIAPDGSISADGELIGQVGVVNAPDAALRRDAGTLFTADAGAVTPAENPHVAQGYLEGANVNPILEISRMIEVQRAYELGVQLLGQHDDLAQQTIKKLGEG